jgi:hypothetical protein
MGGTYLTAANPFYVPAPMWTSSQLSLFSTSMFQPTNRWSPDMPGYDSEGNELREARMINPPPVMNQREAQEAARERTRQLIRR